MTAPVAALIIASAVTLTGVVGCFGPARPAREATARWIAAAACLAVRLVTPARGHRGVRSDTWTREAAAWVRHPVASLQLWLHWWDWWDWPVVQAHYRRQYKRIDRKAFAAECEAIRARATMTPAPAGPPAQAPAAAHPVRQPDAATATPPGGAATLPQPVSPGLGQPPGRDTWVIHQPPPGTPMAPRHAATQPRLVLAAPIETTPLYDELIAVTDGTGPRAVIWPQAVPSTRTTGTLPALGDLPPGRRCSTDVAAFGDSLIAGLRAL